MTCDPESLNLVSHETTLDEYESIAEHEVAPVTLTSSSMMTGDSNRLEAGIISSDTEQSEWIESSESYPVIPKASELSAEATDLIANSLGASWELVAERLGVPESDKNILKNLYLGKDESEHLGTQFTQPGYVPLVIRMLELACEKGKTADDIIPVLRDLEPKVKAYLSKKSYFPLEECVREANSLMYYAVSRELRGFERRWDSYIVLIWIKDPCKVDDSPLPNSIRRPVKQNAIDWAGFNHDKMVVLCYSGSTLNPDHNDKIIIDEFQNSILRLGLKNLILLDLDKANWPKGDHLLFMKGGGVRTIKGFLAASKV